MHLGRPSGSSQWRQRARAEARTGRLAAPGGGRHLVLEVVAQPAAHCVVVLVAVDRHGMLDGGGHDFVLFTRNRERASGLARKVPAVGNFAAHSSLLGITSGPGGPRRGFGSWAA